MVTYFETDGPSKKTAKRRSVAKRVIQGSALIAIAAVMFAWAAFVLWGVWYVARTLIGLVIF